MKKIIAAFLGVILIAVVVYAALLEFYPNHKYNSNPAVDHITSLENLAKSGDSDAMYRMGKAYKNGHHGLEPNDKEAVRWFELAANEGNLSAIGTLALMYKNGDGVDRDLEKARVLLIECAEKGKVPCMGHLGEMFHDGVGVEKDYVKAFHWWLEAAKKGNSNAQYQVGYFYESGKGNVTQDLEQARLWYEKGAEQGNGAAQRYLGYMYYDGEGGVENDYLKAGELFSLATQNGDKEAQRLVEHYSKECHKKRDGYKIHFDMKSCYLAAYSGDPLSMHAVGLSFYDGRFNQTIDHKKAFEWFEKSAKAGFSGAQHFLGIFYEKGIGVQQNKVEAYAWIGAGISQNDRDQEMLEKARQVQEILSNEMSKDQLQEAIQKLELYKKKYIH